MAVNTAKHDKLPTKKSGKYYVFWKPDDYSRRVTARWDSQNNLVFVEACVAEIRKGNRGAHYLTNKGWDGVLEFFYRSTQVYYDQKQLRNHWDTLKQDYTAWSVVRKGATGLGWLVEKGTWDAPPHFWREMSKKYKCAKKFENKGLENVDLLETIFGGRTATGEYQWSPSEYIPTPPVEQETDDVSEYASETMNEDAVELEEHYNTTPELNIPPEEPHVASSSERVRKRVDQPSGKSASKAKKTRQSSAVLLNNTAERILEAMEKQSNEVVVKQFADTCNATVELCLEKLNNLPDLITGSPLYLFGADLMSLPGHREVFMKLPSDEVRLGWLQDKRARSARSLL